MGTTGIHSIKLISSPLVHNAFLRPKHPHVLRVYTNTVSEHESASKHMHSLLTVIVVVAGVKGELMGLEEMEDE